MNNRKKNILVVGNNSDIIVHIKYSLEYLYPGQYNVICINCREKDFKVLEKSHTIPDVILFYISIFGRNEWKILEHLKHNSKWKFIPIIFLSCEGDISAKNFSNFFGDDFIDNPLEIKNLNVKIEQVLAR